MSDLRLDDFWQALDELNGSSSACSLYDSSTPASQLRRRNLSRYLELMAARMPRTLLVGEAPGYRGTAVTGVPFMSVREITSAPGLVGGAADGDDYEVPDEPPFVREATSQAMWSTLAEDAELPLLWAAFPLHPHEPGHPFTNRRPTPTEIRAGLSVTLALVHAFKIERVIAVGRVAQAVLAPHFPAIPYVRHPARGGVAQFRSQLRDLREEQLRS